MRELTPQEKLALLSNSLEDTSADDSSLHVAEVAAVVPIDGDASSDSKNGADTNPPAEP
jgi:hypothetical protein